MSSSQVKMILSMSMTVFLMNCGVKGKPQPPLEAPQLGAGKHPLSTSQKQRKQLENSKKLILPGDEQDWKESDDK